MIKIPFSRTLTATTQIAIKKYKLSRSGWKFSPYRTSMYLFEYKDWLKHYLPTTVIGKVILDVGAGEGETAKFYLEHGASHVYAVENDKDAFITLKENAKNHPKITPIYADFDCGMLEFDKPYIMQLAKIDIEGYEEQLLDYNGSTPVVCEVHGLQLLNKFQTKGWRITKGNPYNCLGYAYWKC